MAEQQTVINKKDSMQFDASCKNVLRYKFALLHVLHFIEEVKDVPDDVLVHCIEYHGDPDSAETDADGQDETSGNADNTSTKNPLYEKVTGEKFHSVTPPGAMHQILGSSNESKSATEGEVDFDLVFTVHVPNSGRSVDLVINVEGQKREREGYPLGAREIYYGARLLSDQFTTLMAESPQKYDACRKVYSVWIRFNPPKELQGTAYSISFYRKQIDGRRKTDEVGKTCTPEGGSGVCTPVEVVDAGSAVVGAGSLDVGVGSADAVRNMRNSAGNLPCRQETLTKIKEYDLIEILEVCLGEYDENDPNSSRDLKFFEAVFSTKLTPEQKKQILQDVYGVHDETVQKEVSSMSGLGEAFYDRGVRDGYNSGVLFGEARGEARGEAKGEAKGEANLLRIAINKRGWTPEQVFDFFDIPKDDWHKYEELLK